jgi:two-component system CheB/CheR fusion protein
MKSDLPDYYIAIGASAGGLEAIEAFFENCDVKTGFVYFVIQHLSPDYKSMMVELLSKKTKMPVISAREGTVVEKDCIYLIPPKQNLTISKSCLHLKEQDRNYGINFPIDIFFSSLALDQKERAVGVIMSGTGSDGTKGIRSIKEHGGIAIVQSPDTAKFDGMPRAAITTELVDFILPAHEIARRIISFKEHPCLSDEDTLTALSNDDDASRMIFALLKEKCNVDFTFYKESTLNRRIKRRLVVNHMNNLKEYADFLLSSPPEVHILYRELLIGVTNFFRDPAVWEHITSDVLPMLFKTFNQREIRFWVPGCSTGEEAYTLAMCVNQALRNTNDHRDIKIFATDIDKNAILKAGVGIYPDSISTDLPPEYLSRYFYKKNDSFQITRSIREMVIFASHNVLKDPPFTNIHMISCRNLLIYFQHILQRKVLEFFNFSLKNGGILLLGSSETTGDISGAFRVIDKKLKIFESNPIKRKPGLYSEYNSGYLSRPNYDKNIEADSKTGFQLLPRENLSLLERFLDVITQQYVPVSLIVNQDMQLIRVAGDASDILSISSGKLTNDISRLLIKELSIPVSTALQKIFSSDCPDEINYTNVKVKGNKKDVVYNIKVIRLPEQRAQHSLAVVFFDDASKKYAGPSSDVKALNIDINQQAAQRIQDLEQDLQFSRESLQATIEELETTNEELQASNEELLASNEELLASNEELQSTNEELYTVNTEYQNKIIELSELNNDVDNLLTNSFIGKILLDENLEIRKFSPLIKNIYSIIDADIGRPLNHIAHKLVDAEPHLSAQDVIKNSMPFEQEVVTREGQIFLMRIFPYKISPTDFSGVVITFIDISVTKELKLNYSIALNWQSRLIENICSAFMAFTKTSNSTYILENLNSKAENVFDMRLEDVKGKYINDLFAAFKDISHTEEFNKILETGKDGHYRDFDILNNQKSLYDVRIFKLSDVSLGIIFTDQPKH